MNRRRWLAGAVAGGVLGALVLVATGAVHDPTHASAFCLQCHADIRASHVAGPHGTIECVDCHLEPGLAGDIVGRWHGIRHARLGWGQDPRSDHHPPLVRVNAAACTRCHPPGALKDTLDTAAVGALARPTDRLGALGLRPEHAPHLAAAAACAACHGPAHRPQSRDPLSCTVCHPAAGHVRERTARARSFGLPPTLAVPPPPAPPPPPPDPDAEAEDEPDDPDDAPVRCSPAGIQRCGSCHNGRSHGNGTKPRGLPNVFEADSPFTCRRCHPGGRNF